MPTTPIQDATLLKKTETTNAVERPLDVEEIYAQRSMEEQAIVDGLSFSALDNFIETDHVNALISQPSNS